MTEFPEQPGGKPVNIAEELTQFAFAQDATAWWNPAFEWDREEYRYSRTPLRAVGTAAMPITLKLGSGTHVALHEAALIDYFRMAVAGRIVEVAVADGAVTHLVGVGGAARHLAMKVGRVTETWAGNSLAVGLSQGFIEPLEATAPHIV